MLLGLFVILPPQKGGIVMELSVSLGKFKINLTIDSKVILALVGFLF
jgi:hypothetical protein